MLIALLSLILVAVALGGVLLFVLGAGMSLIYGIRYFLTKDKSKLKFLFNWLKKAGLGFVVMVVVPILWSILQYVTYTSGTNPLQQNLLP